MVAGGGGVNAGFADFDNECVMASCAVAEEVNDNSGVVCMAMETDIGRL